MSIENNAASCEMPKYQSHKKVWALEIESCSRNPIVPSRDPNSDSEEPGYTLFFVEKGYAPHAVKRGVVSRYFPSKGDFFVVYDDGYESISPRQPFLDGYTRI